MKYERSVGAVVFYDGEFLILKYGLGHWGLVKGNVEAGESEQDTVLRELKEETGITDAKIMPGFKETIHYYYTWEGERISKTVTYFLIKSETKNVTLSYEHDDYKWLPYEEAIKQVTHANVKKVLKKAKEYLSSHKSLKEFF